MAKEEITKAPAMGVFELAPDVTREEMQAVFFDTNALRVPSYRLYQLNAKGERFYYYIGDDGEPVFHPSVTTILGKVMPANPFLEKWKADLGWEQANAYTLERANYGTFLHKTIEEILISGVCDLSTIKGELAKYIEREQLPSTFINYIEDIKKDVLAFAQFVIDYDVKPLCIEESLYSSRGYAGCIDMVCTMKPTPKSKESIVAMVDFKSGRKGFYESHVHQLYLYKDMWLENFPDLPIQSVFNWSPKDWRKSPSYNIKCQDDAIDPRITANLLDQYTLRKKNNFELTIVSGVIDLKSGDISNNYRTISLAELVKEHNTEEEPEDDSPLFPEE
jgi:hypothetical protein